MRPDYRPAEGGTPAEFQGSRFSTNKKPAPPGIAMRAGKHFSYHLLGGCANITSFRF